MKGIDLFLYTVIRPLKSFGYTHPFFNIHLETLIFTWLAMFGLFVAVLASRFFLKKKKLTLPVVVLQDTIEFFYDLCVETLGTFNYNHFAFGTSIFFFTLTSTLIGLFPYCEESTKDLNTALALGISSFTYVQYHHIRHSGIIEYFKDFARPIVYILPIEIISKFASIISMSFRLFGNILGGAIVYTILVNAIGTYKGVFTLFALGALLVYVIADYTINLQRHAIVRKTLYALLTGTFFLAGLQMFFGVFEAFVQAFVLTMLTMTYLSIALTEEQQEDTSSEVSS